MTNAEQRMEIWKTLEIDRLFQESQAAHEEVGRVRDKYFKRGKIITDRNAFLAEIDAVIQKLQLADKALCDALAQLKL